ncbi:helix-turn-helix transcriptional regulator [Salicibibacter cibarius]|uniref:Helix-turn-helix transcriptional regulator n=1 Tax=Salicibibacter cibarius TaxID=2743000 RepID=A0A7T6Z3L9_9BACI|nr:AraC family transcriptional regulator [Salicibibacter cibarius]QQK76163.1 helix-turn-helix transcriptional regulator [Salicibibacter cibarius]
MKKDKIEKSEVMQHLRKYNEQEIFYQKYQQKKQDKKTLQVFLKDYDKDDLKRKQIYIEEFLSKAHKEFEQEDTMWSGEEKDIDVRKYNRFMPHLSAVHDFFEIIYVLENEMFLEVEDESFCLQTGDIGFIPPNTIHKPIIMEDTIAFQMMIRKSTFQKVFFKMLKGTNVISDFFLNALYVNENQNVLIFHSHLDNDISDSFLQLYQENYNQLPGHQLIINNLFEVLLCFLLRLEFTYIKINQVKQHNDMRAIQMLQYIQQHCEHVTIKEMADVFNFSKAYVSKYITRNLGKSFSEILQEIRLEKACEMLKSSYVQIDNIAAAVGYQNVEHFIRLFKRKYQQTPHQYRLNNR